jgi:hypothetical protein
MRHLVVWVVLAACGSSKESAPVVAGDAAAKRGQYDHQHWVEKLASDHDRAVTELEMLGNPAAIPALVAAWHDEGRPIRSLEVIIKLARPLTPDQAKASFVTEYERTGRKASWEAALPALLEAIEALDPKNPRTIDSAERAVAALGESGLPAAHAPLLALVKQPALPALMPVKAAAVGALGRLRTPASASALILAMYRDPALFPQFRRALVAIGGPVKAELKQILLGTHQAVNELFLGDLRSDPPVSAKDFYAAIVLGDFRDPDTTGALLVALQRPMLPVYFQDDQPSPNTQGNAILDALKKIGAPSAAAPLFVLWRAGGDLQSRILAIGAYPFVSRDGAGVAELGAIAADNKADDTLRQEAATAFARLSRDPADIKILDALAKRYLDASAKKRTEAGKLAGTGADPELAKLERTLALEKAKLQQIIADTSSTAAQIKRQTEKLAKLDRTVRDARRAQRDASMPLRQAESAATAYLGYARMFQTHIARIEIAHRCQEDLACFAKALDATPSVAAAKLASYIPDLASWTREETAGLHEASIERALIELGKAGPAAEPHTAKLLEHVATDNRYIREAILLALPKIAKRPCPACITKLDAALATKSVTLAALELETQIVRDQIAAP